MIYATISLDSGDRTFSKTGGEAGVYDGLIGLGGSGEIVLETNEDRSFRTPVVTLRFSNAHGEWDAILTGSDADIIGKKVLIRYLSTTGTVLFKGQIRQIMDSDPTEFIIQADAAHAGLENEGGGDFAAAGGSPMSKDEFTSIEAANEGGYMCNPAIGKIDDTGAEASGMIEINRYAKLTSPTTHEHWAIGKLGASSKAVVSAFKPGTPTSAAYNLALRSGWGLDTDAPGSNTYDILAGHTDTGDANLVLNASFTSGGNLYAFLTSAATWGWHKFGHAVLPEFTESGLTTAGLSGTNIALFCAEKKTGKEFLSEICDSFDMIPCPCVPQDGSEYVVYLRRAWYAYAPTSVATIYPEDVKNYRQAVDTSQVWNAITRKYWWHIRNRYFQRTAVDVADGVGGYGNAQRGEMEQRFISADEISYKMAMRRLQRYIRPLVWRSFDVPIESALTLEATSTVLAAGQIIKVNLPYGYNAGTDRYLRIFRMALNPEKGTASLRGLDLTSMMEDIPDLKLLILFPKNGNSTGFWDYSLSGSKTLTRGGGITNDGGYAGFDGAAEYISLADNANWDLLSQTNVTLAFRVKFDQSLLSVAEFFISQYQDVSNCWYIDRNSSEKLLFGFTIAGVSHASSISASAYTDTASYHDIVLAKVGNSAGLYYDGTQVCFLDVTGLSLTLAGSLYIGQRGDGARWFDGNISCVRLSHSNDWGAAPNVGLTDTLPAAADMTTWSGY